MDLKRGRNLGRGLRKVTAVYREGVFDGYDLVRKIDFAANFR
jgi:hypothetical protein